MMSLYPDFDWSKYDTRTNFPNYSFDNSKSAPDKNPDYVIIAYRYNGAWNYQPNPSMKYWAANYSKLDGLYGLQYNGYSFDGAGFTMAGFDGRIDFFWDLFVHELAHEMFSCPHYSGANFAIGNYFQLPALGWDMMDHKAGLSCNAWERWILGWMDIKHDLRSFKDNGTYTLNDYIKTGDAVRIKIPHTQDQYLWIEYHQNKNVLDHKPWRGLLKDQPKGTHGIADKEPGIYMFIESILDDRSKISDGMVYDLSKVNGILPINASGNWDFKKPVQVTQSPDESWNNKLYWFEKEKENALSGVNPFIYYRHDMDNNGSINQVPGYFSEFNGMRDIEGFQITKEIISGNACLTYASFGGRNNDAKKIRRSDVFQQGDFLSLGTNPVITNRPVYYKNADSLQPLFLNGLYIKIISVAADEALIYVAFDRTDVENDIRWCGNIICKDVPNARKDYDMHITGKSKLTLDLSNTPQKRKSPFVRPTELTIDSASIVFFDDHSTLHLSQGSILRIKNGGRIKFSKNAHLIVDDSSKIIIEKEAVVEIPASASVSLSKKNIDIRGGGESKEIIFSRFYK